MESGVFDSLKKIAEENLEVFKEEEKEKEKKLMERPN